MPLYDYRIAAGNNNAAGLQNIETVLSSGYAPRSTRVPRGSVQRFLGNGRVVENGIRNITWSFDILPKADLDTIVTTYIGGYANPDGLVTIRTRNLDNTYSNYNAVLVCPRFGEDYQEPTTSRVTRLVLTFRNLQSI